MKTLRDIQARFKMELEQWFIKQTRNIYDDYYLYYIQSTPEHDGGIIIAKDAGPNKDYKLATPQPIRKDADINANMILFNDVLRTLPVLSINP